MCGYLSQVHLDVFTPLRCVSHHVKLTMKKFRRFLRKFQYTHPTKRHIVLITICFWLSGITLWTIKGFRDDHEEDKPIFEEDSLLVYHNEDPFNGVIHKEIESWHNDDKNRPKLLPSSDSKWRKYPDQELFSWHDTPVHSVRAMVDNNKTYHGEMGAPVKVPPELEAKAKERYGIHELNVVASELVSLNRRLPDIRHER